mgnify:CR=1 FL=1
MNFSRPFIERPVATTLLMVALLLSGILAYRLLPVAALPQVDYPIIQVTTLYPGASPGVTTSAVTAPLERRLGQIPGLKQMSSTSSGGASVITLQFSLDVDLGVAEQEVQAAINAANNFLPNDLPVPPVYRKVNPADTPILTLAVTAKQMALPEVYDLLQAVEGGEDAHGHRPEDGSARRAVGAFLGLGISRQRVGVEAGVR